jgi:hypothetical protein
VRFTSGGLMRRTTQAADVRSISSSAVRNDITTVVFPTCKLYHWTALAGSGLLQRDPLTLDNAQL